MRRHAQDAPHKPESGGVLLGRHILDTHDIVVDRVTTPLPDDRQSRTRFFRARRRHQALIDQAWRESDGACTYLGEWHTHPEAVPTPSLIDQLDWRRKLLVDRFSGMLYFVIVGTAAVRVWEGRRHRTHLCHLQPAGDARYQGSEP
jgi:integrative and conjugative element protein (TIGR02256 family)